MTDKKEMTREDYFKNVLGRLPTEAENKEYSTRSELADDLKFVTWVNEVRKRQTEVKEMSGLTDKYKEKLEKDKEQKQKTNEILGKATENQGSSTETMNRVYEAMKANELASASPAFKEAYEEAKGLADRIHAMEKQPSVNPRYDKLKHELYQKEDELAEKLLNMQNPKMRFTEASMVFHPLRVEIFENRSGTLRIFHDLTTNKWRVEGLTVSSYQLDYEKEKPSAIVIDKQLQALFSKPKSAKTQIVVTYEDVAPAVVSKKIQEPKLNYRCSLGQHLWQDTAPDGHVYCMKCGVEFYEAEENKIKVQKK